MSPGLLAVLALVAILAGFVVGTAARREVEGERPSSQRRVLRKARAVAMWGAKKLFWLGRSKQDGQDE